MAVEASFAKELSGFQDANHRFLALLGDDENLDPSLLNIENRIRGVPLREHDLVPVKFQYGFALADLGMRSSKSDGDPQSSRLGIMRVRQICRCPGLI